MNGCNWKCSFYGRLKCRARALTKTIGGIDYVKITCAEHNHERPIMLDESSNKKPRIKKENVFKIKSGDSN